MTCHAFKIPDADMKFRADSSVDLLQTASGKRKFYYKGQTIFRRMLVDAWTSELNGLVQEFYFLANSSGSPRNSTKWSERNRFRYPTPVGMLLKNNTATSSHQMSRIYAEFTRTATELTRELKKSGFLPTNETFQMGRKLIRTVSQLSTVYKLNFFHYSPILTSTEYFSVADCYKEAERLPLVVKVNNCSVREVFYNMKGFVNSLRRALADHSNLSIIQISEVALLTPPHLELSQRAKYIYLTLLGTPRVNDVQQLAIGPAKLALAHAIQKGIQFEVQYGNFSKVFRVSKELMEVNSTNFINIFFGPSNKTGQAYSTYRLGSRMRYSPTAVAGVAFSMLTLGASLCLFVSIFLYKKRHPGQSLIALGETE
ncbi:unnamed protein product [Lymnaea stagnalis]|uniref:Uncharacterized protein n=1 Tax=Lymnaea stagnalis TaxID=6523 RepID=A0AAV2HN57_LYMST